MVRTRSHPMGPNLQGMISTRWGNAQAMYYNKSPHTRDSKVYDEKEWMSKMVGAFVDFSLR